MQVEKVWGSPPLPLQETHLGVWPLQTTQVQVPLRLHSGHLWEPIAPETKIRRAATTTITPMMMAYCWALLAGAGGGGGASSPSSAPHDLQAASCRPTLALHSGHLGMGFPPLPARRPFESTTARIPGPNLYSGNAWSRVPAAFTAI